MPLMETIKEKVEKITGWGRPKRREVEAVGSRTCFGSPTTALCRTIGLPASKRQYELIWVGLRLTALWLRVVGLDANLLVSRGLRDRACCEDRGQGQCGNQGPHGQCSFVIYDGRYVLAMIVSQSSRIEINRAA